MSDQLYNLYSFNTPRTRKDTRSEANPVKYPVPQGQYGHFGDDYFHLYAWIPVDEDLTDYWPNAYDVTVIAKDSKVQYNDLFPWTGPSKKSP